MQILVYGLMHIIIEVTHKRYIISLCKNKLTMFFTLSCTL